MIRRTFPCRYSILLSAIIFVGLGVIACSSSSTTHALSADAVVLAFGDSITYGTGASREQSYPRVLEELTGRKVVNAGVPGETTAEGVVRLSAVLEAERPNLMILCLGGNDFLRKLDEGDVEKNLVEMVRMARERGTEVVLVGVPRLGFILKTHPLYKRIAKEQNVPLEGKALQHILSDRSLRADYIHPNAAGYRQLAVAIVDLLAKSGYIAAK